MAEQKSRLVIEISTENAKRNAELLNQELQKLTEKGNKASTSSLTLGKELRTTGDSAKTLGDSTSKATKELALYRNVCIDDDGMHSINSLIQSRGTS